MIEKGILVDGVVLPDTSRVMRSSTAWWATGHHSTRPRQGAVVDLYVQHWTAGQITAENGGPSTYAAMLARKSTKRPGKPLDVAVNFVVGWDGAIWQLADVLTACVHVGLRPVIRRSVSTEHRWPGDRKTAMRLGFTGPWKTVQLDGKPFQLLHPSEDMLEASRWLAETLVKIKHPQVRIPRVVAPGNARYTPKQMRDARGACEHGQMPGSTKVDCAGVLNANLSLAGWGV